MPFLRGTRYPLLTAGSVGRSFSAEAQQFFDRLATQPTGSRKTLYATMIDALVDASVWTKLDALYLFAAADAATALTNLVSSDYEATAQGSPTFTADVGYTGDTNKYIDTNFNPTTAVSPNFVQNSACGFAWSLKVGQDAASLMGTTADAGAQSVAIVPRFTDDKVYYVINTSAFDDVANTDGSGLFTTIRRGATDAESYRNGGSMVTGNDASEAPNNSNIFFLRRNAAYFTGQVACGGFGGQLSAGEQLALYNALLAYLQAVGAV